MAGYQSPPWPPSMDADAVVFGNQLVALYGGEHGSHQPSEVDVLGWVRWSSDYRVHRANNLTHDQAWSKIERAILAIWGVPSPTPVYPHPLVGQLRVVGRALGDATGPRIVHGCSWFPALVIAHQDPDEFQRQLDRTVPHQQYQRWLWRLNGWHWSGDATHASANLSIDPIRDPWFEDTLRWALEQAHQRGLRVNLSTGDMNGWSEDQQAFWFQRVHEIAASVSPDVVWLSSVANEARGTWDGPEANHVPQIARLLTIIQQVYPWALRAGSDPESQDKAGMRMLAPAPATVALIHDVRQQVSDALRRAFNTMYENYPGLPVVQDEPTGPNGPNTGPFSQKVYQPVDDPQSLFAIYTMHVITGQPSTYFSDPALVSRQPLDSTWGFKELPALWRAMEIPQNIGQGTLIPGHKADAPIRIGTGADRCDSVVAPGERVAFGVVSGGGHWSIPSGWDADAMLCYADGTATDKRVREGEILIASGSSNTAPAVIRLTR